MDVVGVWLDVDLKGSTHSVVLLCRLVIVAIRLLIITLSILLYIQHVYYDYMYSVRIIQSMTARGNNVIMRR